jgi:hypothetical protein
VKLTTDQTNRCAEVLKRGRVLNQQLVRDLVAVVAPWLVVFVGSWVMAPGAEVVELAPRWWWRVLGLGPWALRRAKGKLEPLIVELAPAGTRIKLRGQGALTVLRRLTPGAIVLALLLAACSTARVASPIAVYDRATAADYAEAEDHFAGMEGAIPVSPLLYWNDARCQELLDKRDALASVGAGAGGLGGASGLAAVLPEDASRSMRLGFGITTVVLAAATTAISLAARSMSERFEQFCAVERPTIADPPHELEPEPGDRPITVDAPIQPEEPDGGTP